MRRPHSRTRRGAPAPDAAILCALLQRNQNAPIVERRCATHTLGSAEWTHRVACHGRRATSPICSNLSFRHTHSAPALTDLLAGQVQVMFADTPSSIEHVKAGKLRALAVTTAERSEILPGVPTVSEFLPGFEANNWFGVAAPRNTPPEIIDKLNK